MGTDVLKSYDTLQQELEKAKSHLQGLNENIRRIIGRDPQGTHLRGDRKRSFNDSRRNDFNSSNHERQRNREPSPTPAKRRPQEAKSVFSRLSGPPVRDDDAKPRIFSRVIRELPTRQEIVEAQGTDEVSRARNRRMFGCLLGTLQKFCQEESRLKQKEDKKAQIEKKLEEQQLQERENLKKERQNLFIDRKKQQLEVRKLEIKMNYIREFEVWEKSKKDLKNFIKTKSKPHIYYRPKVMNERVEKRLAECQADLERELEEKRRVMNEEIQAIESRFRHLADRLTQTGEKAHTEESATKHDRHDDDEDDDDNDSIYGGHSGDENMERVPSKAIHNLSSSRDDKHHITIESQADKLSDTIDTNASLGDITLELDASQRFDEDNEDRKNIDTTNTSSNGTKKEDKSE